MLPIRSSFNVNVRWENPAPDNGSFPGGKIESGESPEVALKRELSEEIGIDVTSSWALMQHAHNYAHANVFLNVFRVDGFNHEPKGVEGQTLKWATLEEIEGMDVLEAIYPIVQALRHVVA